jgi:hypothetical protein
MREDAADDKAMPNGVIRVDESMIRSHLSKVVVSTVEQALQRDARCRGRAVMQSRTLRAHRGAREHYLPSLSLFSSVPTGFKKFFKRKRKAQLTSLPVTFVRKRTRENRLQGIPKTASVSAFTPARPHAEKNLPAQRRTA